MNCILRQSYETGSVHTGFFQGFYAFSLGSPGSAMTLPTILLVDDDETMTRYYACIFEGKYRVVAASSGHHAVRIAKHSDEIHLVILESRLRDMSGLDVLREIKKCRPSVPAILVTAYGDETVAVKAFRYGVKDYIKKPFSYNELMGRVAFCLSLKHADKIIRKTESAEEHHCSSVIPLMDIASSQHLNIQKALQFINNNCMIKINLAAAAEKACLSRHHFSRAFKKTTGATYQEYVTVRRVQKAKELLRDSRRTITDIAQYVGYSDPNNLIRNFKKHTGLTPTEFRNCRKQARRHS
jgi:YesN/AraC family two-component response regulator